MPLQWDADTDTPADAYYHPDSNSHSYCDGYRHSQGYAAATRDASSSSKSTVIAGPMARFRSALLFGAGRRPTGPWLQHIRVYVIRCNVATFFGFIR